VRLVEQGFSVVRHRDADDGRPIQPDVAYLGFVVENTSDQVALGIRYSYRYLDRDGNVLFEEDSSEFEIAALWPGERFAWGGSDVPDRPGIVAEVVVELGEPRRWVPTDDPILAVGDFEDLSALIELTARDVTVRLDGEESLVVAFTVESNQPGPVRGAVGVILRDRGGGIAAGGVALDEFEPGETTGQIEIPVLWQRWVIDLGGLGDIDPAQTDVYFGEI
jgi:hypothetical protein